MTCPRCRASVPATAEACPRCAAPLRLREEPAPGLLDGDLELDRRTAARRPVEPAQPEEPTPGPGPGVASSRREEGALVRRAAPPRATPPAWLAPPATDPNLAPVPAAPDVAGLELVEDAPPMAETADAWPVREAHVEIPFAGVAPGEIPPSSSPAEVSFADVAPAEAGPRDFDILEAIPQDEDQEEPETEPGQPRPPAPPPTPRPTARGERWRTPGSDQVPLPFPDEVHLERASAIRRVGAWVADAVLAGSLAWLLVAGGAHLAGGRGDAEGGVLLPYALGLMAIVHFVHATLGHVMAGFTLGKWMTGIAVVGPTGRRPGPGRAALRSLCSILSAAPLGLGLLLALFDRRGRALHDLAAGTSVVRTP